MKLVSGNSIWINQMSIPYNYPYLSDDIECEVAIIGAGIVGAICAYYLTEAGIRTVIVDKSIIGYSSTSTSTSILQYEIDNDLIGLSKLIGINNAVRCFKLVEKAVYDIEEILKKIGNHCDFELKDCLYYTYKPGDVQKIKYEYFLRKEYGFDVQFIDKHTAAKLYTFDLEAGILSKPGSGQINPYAFAHQLISYGTANGLSAFENTEISRLSITGDSVILETNLNKRIKAKKAIISTGYEAIKNIHEKIADFTRTFTIASKPVAAFDGWFNKCIIRDNESAYNYIRTTADNRIIMGGEDIEIGRYNNKAASLKNAEAMLLEKYNILERKMRSYFPLIKDIEIEYKFNGIFGTTKDELPYIGEYVHYPNCYFCLGYGANGILYGIIGAQLIKELYMGNKPLDLELFRFGR